MDREQLASRIGSRYVRNAMFVGLGCAALIFLLIGEGKPEALFDLLTDSPVQAFICVVIGPLMGHLVGMWAGKKILLQGGNARYVTLTAGFACVWSTTLMFSLIGFFQEGIHGSDPLVAIGDYIVMPLVAVTYVGGLFIFLMVFIVAAFFDQAPRKHFSAQP